MGEVRIPLRKKLMAWILSVCLTVTLIPELAFAAAGDDAAVKTGSEDVTQEKVIEKSETSTTYELGSGEQMTCLLYTSRCV